MKMSLLLRVGVFGVATLAVTALACGGGAPPPSEPTQPSSASSPTPQTPPTPSPAAPPTAAPPVATPTGGPSFAGIDPQAVPAAQAAVQALTKQASVAAAAVQVVGAEPVDWRDGSLGCPQPGMVYTQSIVPGYRITLTANGKTYEYHTDRSGRRVVTCS